MKFNYALSLTLLSIATVLYLTFNNIVTITWLTSITLPGLAAFFLSPIGIYSVMAIAIAFCFWNMQSYRQPVNTGIISDKDLKATISEMLYKKTPEHPSKPEKDPTKATIPLEERSSATDHNSKKDVLAEMLSKRKDPSTTATERSSVTDHNSKKDALAEMLSKRKDLSTTATEKSSDAHTSNAKPSQPPLGTNSPTPCFHDQIKNFKFRKNQTVMPTKKPTSGNSGVLDTLRRSKLFESAAKANGHATGYESDRSRTSSFSS